MVRVKRKWEEALWSNEKETGFRIRNSVFIMHVQIVVPLLTGYLILSKFFPYL